MPVLIAMLSNHYGWLHGGTNNWGVLVVLMLAGALIRHSFVARHKARVQGHRAPWGYAIAGVVAIAGLIVARAPAPSASSAGVTVPRFAEVQAVIQQRCVLCHNAQVQNKNVALHTAELVLQHAQAVYQQAAVLKQMPMNNATQISEDERALIRRWFEAGAPHD